MGKPNIQREDILSVSEVEDMINKATNLRDKALVSVLYILGARINEIISLRKKDIKITKDSVTFSIEFSKKRSQKYINERHEIIVAKKTIFLDNILSYLVYLTDEDRLFKMSRQRAWQIIKKLNPECWPHLFRDTRLTKLALQGATAPQLMVWAGWKNIEPATDYLYRSSKMIDNLKEKID